MKRRTFLAMLAALPATAHFQRRESASLEGPLPGILEEAPVDSIEWRTETYDYGNLVGHAVKITRGPCRGRAAFSYHADDPPTPEQMEEARRRCQMIAYRALRKAEAGLA